MPLARPGNVKLPRMRSAASRKAWALSRGHSLEVDLKQPPDHVGTPTPKGVQMRVLHVAALLAGLGTLASPLAQAQAPDTLNAAQRAGLALAHLGAGQRVQIVTRQRKWVDGFVVATSPNLLSLKTDGSVTDIPAASVDSV